VSLLAAVLLSLVPAGSSANGLMKQSQLSRGDENPRTWVAGLQSYAALGNWLLNELADRMRPERRVAIAPPVTAFLNPAPFFIDAPTNLTVTATSDTSVNLSWTAPTGFVDHYQVERSQSISGPFLILANTTATTLSDTTVSVDHAYLYRVRTIGTGGIFSAPGNMALGTATTFEFSSLQGQLIKAQHVYDLRTTVNAVRAAANLPAATWSPRDTLTGLFVEANDVQVLRNKLDEALAVLSIAVTAYDDPTLSTGANGTLVKAIHFEQLQTRSTRGSSSSSGPVDSDSSTARLDPLNETGGGGENPLSRNFNWNLPLVRLPGRADLDLGLTLSYNSLVWTKSGTNLISFDDDKGFPAPGFRLGFPVIQPIYYNLEVGKYAFLLIGPDGSRVEFRQVGTSALYEAVDSSHMLLDSSTMVLRTSDGTQLSYVLHSTQYDCTQIKDRNGNYINVSYTAAGRINTVTDTLGRIITFNYDVNGYLTDITQVWNQNSTPVTHYWARFEYANVSIDYNFGGMTVYGPADNSTLKMLSRVKLADDSYFDFSYSSWGQVWKVSNFAADTHLLNYRFYNLPQTADPLVPFADCPRFTERHDWAQYWNGDTDGTTASNEEALTAFAVPVSDSWTMPDNTAQSGTRAQVTAPDGTSNKIYYIGTAGTSSGWQRGLPASVNTYDSTSVLQRQSTTAWTQDNTAVSYQLNPRVIETNVYDPAGNRARTQTTYQQFTYANGTSCQFPRDTYEYAANASTILRSTRVDYHSSTTYTDRRILDLVTEKRVYEGDVNNGGTLKSKVGFFYDNENGATSIQGTDAPVQHDNTNYSASFVAGRGNLSSIRRYDINDATFSTFTTQKSKYNTAGVIVSSKDGLDHEVTLSYADSFSDGNNTRNTLAYPTMVTDPDGYSSTTKYHFDFAAVTYIRTPQPNVTTNTPGPEQTFTFDVIGRLQQKTNVVNGAYARYEYSTSNNRVDTYMTIQDGLGESHSFQVNDGAGRAIATAADHPGSTGGFSGKRTIYDVMGRVFKTSNPTETNASGTPFQWTTAGDDAAAGWIYTQQTFDWKGRPLVTTNQDGTTSTASYTGCGCAGGEVVTLTDEGTIDAGVAKKRQHKTYSDVLGRTVKTEILTWEGGSVYSATVNTYSVLDQVVQVRQYAGAEGSGMFQDTTSTYDGYGRLKTQHVPEQDAGVSTTWDYNADDTIQKVTDARGATATYSYNNRHQQLGIAYAAPSPIPGTPTTSFTYDAAGNRTSMTDASGSTTYQYSQLSKLVSEVKTITGLATNYSISYEYTLAGNLKSVTDPVNHKITYGYDRAGRLDTMVGTNYPVTTLIQDIAYRAWNSPRQISFGNARTLNFDYNNRLSVSHLEMPATTFPEVIKKDYEYYNDQRLKYVKDYIDPRYDRGFNYDHAERLIKALSGAEARGEPATGDRPYNQTTGYDAFNHVTSRTTHHWSRKLPFISTNTFVNNRRTGWTYDAAGNLISDGSRTFTFDTAGRMIASSGGSLGQVFDGDGRRVKSTEPNVATYYLNSTVLGQVLTQLDGSGNKQMGFIYAFGQLIGEEYTAGTGAIGLVHKDASGLSIRKTNAAVGNAIDFTELDPQGADVELDDPYLDDPGYHGRDPGGPLFPGFGNVTAPGDCTVDGVWMPCDMAYRLLGSGAAVQCPDNYCGPIAMRVKTDEGQTVSFFRTGFMAFANGVSGNFFPTDGFGTPQQQADDIYLGTIYGGSVTTIDNPRNYFVPTSAGGGVQLSDCLRNALREYFPQQSAQGKTFSPIDDARFKNWIPDRFKLGGVIPGTVAPGAITLGLYDIHYDPHFLDLSGGSSENLKTILEEVSHTIQFIQEWAKLKQNPYLVGNPGSDVSYETAQIAWQEKAIYHWVKAGGSYDNSQIELWAKKNANDILNRIVHDPRYENSGNLCGFDLRSYHIILYP